MYRESKAECGKCGRRILDGETLKCKTCYNEIKDQNIELIERITELEKRIKKLTRGGTQ